MDLVVHVAFVAYFLDIELVSKYTTPQVSTEKLLHLLQR